MSCGSFRYLFGPIASRRFGRSLGIDLLGQRVCSFNCVFCEAGPTQTCTLKREAYTPIELVLGELRAWLGAGGAADVVTLAGRGEPTLHSGFGSVIDAIHAMCRIPVVLLSNGSLMWMPEVRQDAARADIVKISLSGWDDHSLGAVNQPAAGLLFKDYLAGLVAFRAAFRGELRLEVMFVRGLNDAEADVRKIARYAQMIGADKVELNTVVRPPADRQVAPVSEAALASYAGLFGPQAVVIGPQGALAALRDPTRPVPDLMEQIASLLGRRGCTVREISLGLDVPLSVVEPCLQQMLAQGLLVKGLGADPYYEWVLAAGGDRSAGKRLAL